MLNLFRRFLLVFIVRPLVWLVIGLDVQGRGRLPSSGPAIIAANHNSHLDTILLLCLFPSRLLRRVRPVAAADHFLKTPLSSWFSRRIVGVLPVVRDRPGAGVDALAECKAALSRGEILLIFPEGTRGEPEQMGRLKLGVASLAEAFPASPIVPVYLQGAGRVLPRGAFIPVPFNCSIIIGSPITWGGHRLTLMDALRSTFDSLRSEAPPLRWI